eukprot:1157587-Pelagomonas_calceolata.AAC.7
MGATNRKDVLDAALTRPGRFDRAIEVMRPDFVGRLEGIKASVHAFRHLCVLGQQQVNWADWADWRASKRKCARVQHY